MRIKRRQEEYMRAQQQAQQQAQHSGRVSPAIVGDNNEQQTT
ncbi:MAG: hypothetical protein V3V96_14030 [Acidiferrobacterales bacterium]